LRSARGVGLDSAIVNETKKLGIQIVASEGYDPDPRAFPTAVPEAIRRLSAALGQPSPDATIIFITFEDDGIIAVQAADEDACYAALNTRSTTPAGEIT
jgi:branched-chain amino acid transport system substrate-binding protein